MDNPKELTHISLCAGYGGIDLGLRRALRDIRTVAFSEIEAFACENLVAKIEAGHLDPAPIWTDLKTFPWESFRSRVDILSGGFPCQPFSAAGRRAGDSDPRHLWPFITNGIRRLGHPPLVFLENVEGIISSKLKGDGWADPAGTPVLLHVLRELERLGYNATAGVFSASETGAPHQRKRVFILGCRSELSEAGREVVGRLLRETEQELAYSESPRGERERRTMGQEAIKTRRENDGAKSHCGGSTAYPAPRGAEQYPWEPPRVTMGNTNSRSIRPRFIDSPLSSETIEKGQTSKLSGSDPDRYEQPGKLGDSNIKRLQGDVPTMEPREREQAHTEPVTRSGTRRDVQGQAQPSLGGDADGDTYRMDNAELYVTCDNRTDELRLLGNGVVPATAERAFRFLWADLRGGARA